MVDEVLAVGDAAFQQKCFEYFEFLKQKKSTIVFVSHDMGVVKRFCDRALLIEDGEVKKIGSPEKVAGQYTLDNIDNDGPKEKAFNDQKKNLSDEVVLFEVQQLSPKKLNQKDILTLSVKYKLSKKMDVDLGYSVVSSGFSVAEQNTKSVVLPNAPNKEHIVQCDVPLKNLNPGSYSLDVAIFTKPGFKLIGYEIGPVKFVVGGIDNLRGGPMKSSGKWRLND